MSNHPQPLRRNKRGRPPVPTVEHDAEQFALEFINKLRATFPAGIPTELERT
jgi:hypothetical protein